MIGGLQKALLAIGSVFVSFVASKIFISKIVHKIYQVRNYNNFQLKGKHGASTSKNTRETHEATQADEL